MGIIRHLGQKIENRLKGKEKAPERVESPFRKKPEKVLSEGEISPENLDKILITLKLRFQVNRSWYPDIEWKDVENSLRSVKNHKLLETLFKMDEDHGEPALAWFDQETGEYVFCEFGDKLSDQRSYLRYDGKGKADSAVDCAKKLGMLIPTLEEYSRMQNLQKFDRTDSSWVIAPLANQKKGRIIDCSRLEPGLGPMESIFESAAERVYRKHHDFYIQELNENHGLSRLRGLIRIKKIV